MSPFPPVPGADWFKNSLKIQATTGVSGFALQNATPTILTWAVPNDGRLHFATIYASVSVASTQTGGSCSFNWTSGGIAISHSVFPGGAATGTGAGPSNNFEVAVDPGTNVTFAQAGAMTAGTATVFAAIWGS
jgi:hypothetical protein